MELRGAPPQGEDAIDELRWKYWQATKEGKGPFQDSGRRCRRVLARLQGVDVGDEGRDGHYLEALAACDDRQTVVDAADEAWALQEPR